jgi:flagellar biosynthetic protein FliO
MASQPKTRLNPLVERFTKLPKWLQYSIGSFIVILAIILFVSSSPSNASVTDPFGNSFAILVDVTLKLGLVVVLIFVAAIVYRRWRPGTIGGSIRQLDLLETMPLGPRRTLYVVKAGEQKLLIGATDTAISLIADLTSQDDILSDTALSPVGNSSADSSTAITSTGNNFSEMLSVSIDKQDQIN